MIPTRRQQAQPGQWQSQWQSNWQSNWQSQQANAANAANPGVNNGADELGQSAGADATTGTAVTATEDSPEATQDDGNDDPSKPPGKSALAPTLTIFIVLALIAIACLYWTRRRKRFVKEEQKRLEVETMSSSDKDEKDSMFARMESPPPIYTRSSSLIPSARNSAYEYENNDNSFNNSFNNSYNAPTVRFAGAQIPSRSTSVSNLSMSNAGTASNRSSVVAPYRSSVMLPPKTYTPFEDTVRY